MTTVLELETLPDAEASAGAPRPDDDAAPRSRSRWPLVLILGLQSLVSLVTLRNTAFQDEALYLYAGRQLVHYWAGGAAPLDHYAFYFSGYPGVYPVIGGVLDMAGGIELARAFSLLCMLGVTALVYFIARRLFGQTVAAFSSAVYASLGTVLFVGRLATFDSLCLLFVAMGAALAVHVASRRRPWLALAIGPVLVLAVLAKYAALLFDLPAIAILVLGTVSYFGVKATLGRLVLLTTTLAASVAVAYAVIDHAAFHAITGSTTSRIAILQKSRLDLLRHVLYMGGLVYALALIGLVVVWIHSPRLRPLAVVLFASSWLPPLYHIYEREAISLDKHMAFGLFFAAPLAGYALAWVSGYARGAVSELHRGTWLAGVAIVLAVLTVGLRQSQQLFSAWANTSGLTYALHTQIRNGSGRILAEDIEVTRYDARDITQQWQWNGVQYFYYARSVDPLKGDAGLAQAIKDRYFAFVELSFNDIPGEADFVAQQMAATRNYDLIAVVPFRNSFGRGHFFLWRSASGPGQGSFTNVAQVETKSWYKTCTQRVCQT